jgi:ubiquitin C-terminal hydrolase
MLDGLHEDLNLRVKKPFIEDPESKGRATRELSLEYHANSLRRDWSFMNFMFTGQLKSSIRCDVCRKENIKFENFTSIPLPLPEPKKRTISIII